MRPHLIALAFGLVTLVATDAAVYGGPTVLRDELVTDTAITPSLGRGYSLSTNTYQSMCLIDVVATNPSYDFDYRFQEISNDQMKSSSSSESSSSHKSENQTEDHSWWFFTWKTVTGNTKTDTQTNTTVTTKEESHYQFLLVTIAINVYYNAVDESKSKMSPAAGKLLTDKDLPGFFDACGMYYVRSISRKVTIEAMFVYNSKSSKRSVDFDSYLKTEIRHFDAGALHDVNTQSSRSSDTNFEESKSLQIITRAVGLGKMESTDLIAYDLGTFRASIKSAFKAAMPQGVGRITAIEVAPWIENTEFQSLNRLEPMTVPLFDSMGFPIYDMSDPSKNPPPQKTKQVLPYEQKRLLQGNAEFLSEVDRAARAKLNFYYKAKRCRATINIDFMTQGEDGAWTFAPALDDKGEAKTDANGAPITVGDTTIINNNRQPGKFMRLSDLDAKLSNNNLSRMWMEYDAFMYGGTGEADPEADKDPAKRAELAKKMALFAKPGDSYPVNVFPGAGKCISDLFAAGITARSYRTVVSCQRLEESFLSYSSTDIEDYCMPKMENSDEVAAQKLAKLVEDSKKAGAGNVSGVATCGNGKVEKGEQCDDGNIINKDGCSSQCRRE
jgi:cysteine-rich repeat protein